ncbi:FIST signal transduction protein [Roseomonas mucosa]|uniref:FIST signal transduction protein n=1 Tax=Roseomonas mucosa TaxID=207340 RepID=UPI002B41028B|nr:FIST N-terminal domain-containing protein [Roseomonas mucosa]QDD96897.1 putative membrane associated protein [Roseomonas mucosa]
MARALLGNVWKRAACPAIDHEIVTVCGRGSTAQEAVQRCDDALRQQTLAAPTLLLVFIGGKHNPDTMLSTLTQYFPGVTVVGGSAAGVIGASECGYSGLEVGIIAFFNAATTPWVHTTHALEQSDYGGGRMLGADARREHNDSSVVLLLYDSVRSFEPRELHVAGSVLEGFESCWREVGSVVGGGLLTDLNLTDSWMLLDGAVHRHAAAALVFPPCVTATTVVLRACRPVSTYMTITRIEGAEVFELDNRPALEVIEARIGQPLIDVAGHPNRIMTLGKKLDDPWEDGEPDDYVNRLILTGNRDTGSITLFEPDFAEGAMVQLMQNDNELMLAAAREGAVAAMRAGADAGEAILRLYIDCAGRASVMSGTDEEEASVVTKTLIDRVPFMGFYSGVEIAPIRQRSQPLDWTGVLTTLKVQRP